MKRLFAGLVALIAGIAAAAAQPMSRPVVIELFTSQGCADSPAADRLLAELAQRPDVLAFELHVSLWDYMGWRDPFGQRAFDHRQRGYLRAIGQPFAYTPQVVIDGRLQELGTNRAGVLDKIEQARRTAPAGPRIEPLPGGVRLSGDGPDGTWVWLVVFDPRRETQVEGGENRGRRLINTNVVRRWELLGRYRAPSMDWTVAPPEPSQRAAIVVQSGEGRGPIIGAALLQGGR